MSMRETLDHARFISKYLKQGDIQSATIAVLFELGIPRKRIGFSYLMKAIVMFHENPVQLLSKELYVAVGKQYEPAAGAFEIEQAIRSVISAGWKNRSGIAWDIYFPLGDGGRLSKPSNGEFIASIAYFLNLIISCYEKEVSYETR